jgi:Ca2+-binding EF-hand superfamily protein
VLVAAGAGIGTAVAADAATVTDNATLKTGLSPLAQLLQLMDTDKNGKVSRDEFLKFMQAEFDYADTNKDGQLDPAELKRLVYKMNHPYAGVRNAGK